LSDFSDLTNGIKPRGRRGLITESNDNVNIPGFTSDDFEDNLTAFIRSRRAANRSDETIRYYREQLGSFMRTLEKQGVATRLQRLTSDIITEHFIEYSLEVRRVKYSTVATCLRAVRAFLNWAEDRGVIEESPMKGITISAPKVSEVETFTRDQFNEILRQPNLETFVGLRDYVIMVVLLETGIRVRELCDINVGDIRWADSQILVHGKNGNDRLVPFQAQTRRVLKRYLKARGASYVDSLFITQDDGKMSRKAVQDRISKYGRMAGITNVRCSPHTFRHTFAKMSVRNGANLFDLQKILGHQSLEMVRVYVNLFSSEVAEAHAKFSPIENLHLRN